MMKKGIYLIALIFSGFATAAQQPDRTSPPPLGAAKNLELPPLQRFNLSNGLNVLLVEKHTVPLVQINVLMQTGAFDDPEGKEGLSSFAMDMLDEGAGSLDALQLADEIEFLGAWISTYSSNFSSGVNTNTPVSKLDPVLKIIADILLRPILAEQDIERVRKLRLSGLLQAYDEPNVIAIRAFGKALFDASSPYGKFPNEQSVKSYTRNDIDNFRKTNFVTGNTTVIIVGDVSRATITPLLEKYFSDYPAGNVDKKPRPIPAQVKGRPIHIIDKPGAAQSVIRIGRIGPPRSTVDYENIVVANTILGGSFTSRLNTNLREVHGYSYGAGSSFNFWNIPSPFTASSSVQTDVTGPALGEFFKEFKNIRSALPQGDFERGKNYEALGYASNFESNTSIANELTGLILYQLPDSYFNTYVERVLKVNKKGVEAAAKKYIVPDNMLVVIVGDRQKIEEGIKKLNLGKITYSSIEDVLGKKPAF